MSLRDNLAYKARGITTPKIYEGRRVERVEPISPPGEPYLRERLMLCTHAVGKPVPCLRNGEDVGMTIDKCCLCGLPIPGTEKPALAAKKDEEEGE